MMKEGTSRKRKAVDVVGTVSTEEKRWASGRKLYRRR